MAKQGEHGITWTDESWNPIRGCSRVSEGCRNCYAERVAARFSGPGQPYHGLARLVAIGHDDKTGKVLKTRPQWTGDVAFVKEHLLDPLRWQKPRMVFVNSMSDLFHEGIPDEWIDKIVAVMAFARKHTFQVLTKRSERMMAYCSDFKTPKRVAREMVMLAGNTIASERKHWHHVWKIENSISKNEKFSLDWPLPNVWWGISAEDQKTFDHRTILLKQTPAAVRWLSLEPLLGPIDLTKVTAGKVYRAKAGEVEPLHYSAFWEGTVFFDEGDVDLYKIDWVVVGGESGPEARPMHPTWARDIRDQCVENKVPFFFKQWGEWVDPRQSVCALHSPGEHTYVADGYEHSEGCPNAKTYMIKAGKKIAGDFLDGRQWREFPKVNNA